MTCRNDRSLRTDRGEPVRNRERWTVIGVATDGAFTRRRSPAARAAVILPGDYVRTHVRLGYAATAHGHQGDTVDVGIAVVTSATTHRSLYVGATRGREDNRLLVVTEGAGEARDVLAQVLANDRADIPAVAQRGRLLREVRGTRQRPDDLRAAGEESRARAQRALDDALRPAEPYRRALREAQQRVHASEVEGPRRNREQPSTSPRSGAAAGRPAGPRPPESRWRRLARTWSNWRS